MNTDEGFEFLGRQPATPASAEQSPEDFLFAVPEADEDGVTNPYGDDNGFDDEVGQGPCYSESNGLDSLEFDMPGAGAAAAPPVPDTPSVTPASAPPAQPAPGGGGAGRTEADRAAELMPPPASKSKKKSGPRPAYPGAQVTPEKPLARIPGRNRVSYSQGKMPAVRSSRPAAPKPQPSVANALIPLGLFFSGSGLAAYMALAVGSPVFAGVAFTLGVIAAMFCRVLLRD